MRPSVEIDVVTPTTERQPFLGYLHEWVGKQSVQPKNWFIVSDSRHPPGWRNFYENLLSGLEMVHSDAVVFMEDDDYYGPDHLAHLRQALRFKDAAAADVAVDLHVPSRRWRIYPQMKAAQLGCVGMLWRNIEPMRRALLELLQGKGDWPRAERTPWRNGVRPAPIPVTRVGLRGLVQDGLTSKLHDGRGKGCHYSDPDLRALDVFAPVHADRLRQICTSPAST